MSPVKYTGIEKLRRRPACKMQLQPRNDEPPAKRQRGDYPCECGVDFAERRALVQHQKTARSCSVYGNPQKKHVCEHCGDTFARKDVRDKHARRKHSLVSIVGSYAIRDERTSTQLFHNAPTYDASASQIAAHDTAHDDETATVYDGPTEVEQQFLSLKQTRWVDPPSGPELLLTDQMILPTDSGHSPTPSSAVASEAELSLADSGNGSKLIVTPSKDSVGSGLAEDEHNEPLPVIMETSSATPELQSAHGPLDHMRAISPDRTSHDTNCALLPETPTSQNDLTLYGVFPHVGRPLDCDDYLQDLDHVMDLIDWTAISTWTDPQLEVRQDSLIQTDGRLSTDALAADEESSRARMSRTSIYRMLTTKRRHDRARSDSVVYAKGASKFRLPKCGFCGEPYEQDQLQLQAHLDSHLEALKAQSDTLTCQECQVTFVQEQDLRHHQECAQHSQCCMLAANHEGQCKGYRCGFNFTHAEPCQCHHPPSDNPEASADHERFKYGLLLREGLLLRREITQVGGVTRLREVMNVRSVASCPGGSFFRWSTASMGASVYTNRSDPFGRMPTIAELEDRLTNLKLSSPVARLRRNAARITRSISRQEGHLIAAVKRHDIEAVASLAFEDADSSTALLIAIAMKGGDMVNIILGSRPAVTVQHLSVACVAGDAAVVGELVKSRKLKNLLNIHGSRLLHIAVVLNNTAIFETLCRAGVAVATLLPRLPQQDFDAIGSTLGRYFELKDKQSVPRAFPTADPTTWPEVEDLTSAIHLAACYGNTTIVRALLAANMDVTVTRRFSHLGNKWNLAEQVLHAAVELQNVQLLHLALEYGASVDTPSGTASLEFAMSHWQSVKSRCAATILRDLLLNGACLEGTEEEAGRLLRQAIDDHNCTLIEALVRAYSRSPLEASDVNLRIFRNLGT
ncbi:hypothetical protein LTR86_011117 [Recurvomyces mirabilis]|nr:hypothetical protein LTR86_011117 [Recurvomyces mirabilis]